MASSVDDTCRLWNCRVRDDSGDIVGPGGDCERLRPLLKHVETDTLRANELAWMSDMTPHESLPLKGGGRRQYFRLVVGEVSAWYAAHSTPNPNFDLASAPGGPAVVAGDKFANAGAYAYDDLAERRRERDLVRARQVEALEHDDAVRAHGVEEPRGGRRVERQVDVDDRAEPLRAAAERALAPAAPMQRVAFLCGRGAEPRRGGVRARLVGGRRRCCEGQQGQHHKSFDRRSAARDELCLW
jgi:hypothetical protein